jgi:hypothetical protein
VAASEDVARHAVAAAEVAAVGDRYPQIAQWSGAAVADRRPDRVPSCVPRCLPQATSVSPDSTPQPPVLSQLIDWILLCGRWFNEPNQP